MANIRNSITLTDRMTPTLRTILKAVDSTLRVMKQLDRQANKGAQSKAYRQAEADIKRANNALIKMRNYAQMANNAARDGQRAYTGMGNAITRASSAVSSLASSSAGFLQSLASGVWLAKRLANYIGEVTTRADASRSQVARMGLYNNSQYTNEELYGQVFSTAMQTRMGLTETYDLVNKMLISGVFSGENSVLSAIGTADIINRALIAGGGSHEENQRSLLQLTQGLSSGVLQGDELRSIREQTPYLAQTLAEGLAKIDSKFEGIGIGDLKELGAQGELTADRIVKAMWAMQDEINRDFESMPKTFGQAVTSLSNIWQYFLYLLSDADGPLGKINNRLWQFVEYLQTPQGFQLMESVAIGINFITTAISGAMGAVGEFVVFLQNNVPVAQALFIALGTAAVAAGIKAAIAWIAAAWPILLVIALVGVLAYYFLSAGYTAGEVVGFIAGGVMWLVAIIWNALVWILKIVAAVIYGIAAMCVYIGAIAAEIVLGIVQIIIWAVMAIVTAIWFVLSVVKTVFSLIDAVIRGVIVGVVGAFVGLAQAVLYALGLIAQGIDFIFGSNLADTVSGWASGLDAEYTAFVQAADPSIPLEDIETTWSDFGSGVADMFTNGQYNVYDDMGDLWQGAQGIDNDMYDTLMNGFDSLDGLMVDPNSWFTSGSEWGQGLVNEIGGLNLSIPDSSILDGFNVDDVTLDGGHIDGGYLDGIKGDVDISDEDIKLLRDMAARDYLLQLQSITPVANVTFGDVRETADVNKILDVIETMVEEQMATALVN